MSALIYIRLGRTRPMAAACCMFFCLSSCGTGHGPETTGVGAEHPTPENLVADGPVRRIVHDDPEEADEVSSVEPILGVGVSEGPEPYMLGSIADAALGDSGRILVLDEANNEVRVYAENGKHLTRFGRQGNGPGEFRRPTALDVSPTGDLFVLDAWSQVNVFSRGPKNTYPHERTFAVTSGAQDLCLIRDTLYVYGWEMDEERRGSVVHAYGVDGVRGNSFGTGYNSPLPGVQKSLSKGIIACSTDRVAVGYQYLPVIRTYDLSGSLLWSAVIPDFTPARITETVTGVKYWPSRPGERRDIVASVSFAEDGTLVVQAVRQSMPAKGTEVAFSIRTFAFPEGDSAGAAVPSAPQAVIHDFGRRNRSVGWSMVPHPRVFLFDSFVEVELDVVHDKMES